MKIETFYEICLPYANVSRVTVKAIVADSFVIKTDLTSTSYIFSLNESI